MLNKLVGLQCVEQVFVYFPESGRTGYHIRIDAMEFRVEGFEWFFRIDERGIGMQVIADIDGAQPDLTDARDRPTRSFDIDSDESEWSLRKR